MPQSNISKFCSNNVNASIIKPYIDVADEIKAASIKNLTISCKVTKKLYEKLHQKRGVSTFPMFCHVC